MLLLAKEGRSSSLLPIFIQPHNKGAYSQPRSWIEVREHACMIMARREASWKLATKEVSFYANLTPPFSFKNLYASTHMQAPYLKSLLRSLHSHASLFLSFTTHASLPSHLTPPHTITHHHTPSHIITWNFFGHDLYNTSTSLHTHSQPLTPTHTISARPTLTTTPHHTLTHS